MGKRKAVKPKKVKKIKMTKKNKLGHWLARGGKKRT